MFDIALTHISNIFIGAMLLLLWGWDLPKGSRVKAFVHCFSKPIVWLGLSHNWSMFAPNPISSNERLRVEIRLNDGNWHEVVLDCMGMVGAAQRPHDIRALKMLHSLTCKGSNALKPAVALYCARRYLSSHPDISAANIFQIRLIRLYQLKPLWPPRQFNYNNFHFEEETYLHDFSKDRIWKKDIDQTESCDRRVAA